MLKKDFTELVVAKTNLEKKFKLFFKRDNVKFVDS